MKPSFRMLQAIIHHADPRVSRKALTIISLLETLSDAEPAATAMAMDYMTTKLEEEEAE